MFPYIIIPLGLLFLILFLIIRDKHSSVLAIIVKTITSSLFVILAMLAYYLKNDNHNKLSFFIVIGLLCGACGDILLDLKVYLKGFGYYKRSDLFMSLGFLVFGIGHIFYILSFGFDNIMDLLISTAIGAIIISVIFLISIKVMKMEYGKFFIPCLVYGCILATFTTYSVFVVINNFTISHLLIMIGSILFLISDLVLSINYFSNSNDYYKEGLLNPEGRLIICLNHGIYYVAQFIIACSLLCV